MVSILVETFSSVIYQKMEKNKQNKPNQLYLIENYEGFWIKWNLFGPLAGTSNKCDLYLFKRKFWNVSSKVGSSP